VAHICLVEAHGARAGILERNAAFAEDHRVRNRTIGVLVLLAVLTGLWYFGVIERYMPNVLPLSPYVQRVRAQETKDAQAKEAAKAAAASQAATNAATQSQPATAPESAPSTAK